MGKRRMIFGNISTSKKFNGLKTDQARLLYLMMYPHSDDFGRIEAEPSAIKMTAVPGLDWSFASIQEYIDDLSTSKLISIYENNGSKYLEFIAFDDHQIFNRQRVGKYPPPLEQSESSKNGLNSLKISKVKISKVKESKDKYLDFVFLTKDEYNKLIDRFGKNQTDGMMEILNNYIGSKGDKYKSHYYAMVGWVLKRWNEDHPVKSGNIRSLD